MFDESNLRGKFKTRAAAENLCKKNGGFEKIHILANPKNTFNKMRVEHLI